MSSFRSARLMSSEVASRTHFKTASVSEPVPNFSATMSSCAMRAAVSGSGTSRERGRWCSVLISAWILSLSMPGTSHSQRSSFTWFSAKIGTSTVTPSRASPGSCR